MCKTALKRSDGLGEFLHIVQSKQIRGWALLQRSRDDNFLQATCKVLWCRLIYLLLLKCLRFSQRALMTIYQTAPSAFAEKFSALWTYCKSCDWDQLDPCVYSSTTSSATTKRAPEFLFEYQKKELNVKSVARRTGKQSKQRETRWHRQFTPWKTHFRQSEGLTWSTASMQSRVMGTQSSQADRACALLR